MSAIVRKEEDAVYFLTEASSEKINEIERELTVQLSFSDQSSNSYLVVKGLATVVFDPVKAKDLWNQFASAFWDRPEDPRLRIIRVKPVSAEYWDGPGPFLAASKMLWAAIGGGKPDLGEHKKAAM